MTALRETPPPGQSWTRDNHQALASVIMHHQGEGKRKERYNIRRMSFVNKIIHCWKKSFTVSLTNSIFSAWWGIAGILNTTRVRISFISGRTGADSSVAGGPALGSSATRWGDTGISRDGLSLLLSEDTNSGQSSAKSVIDNSRSLWSWLRDSDWTALNGIAARGVIPAWLTPNTHQF